MHCCKSNSPCGCQERTPLPPAAGSGSPGWGTCCHCWNPGQAAAQHLVQGRSALPRALPHQGTPTAGLPGGAGPLHLQPAGAVGAGRAHLKGGQAASCPVLRTLQAPERPAPARAGGLWCAAAAAVEASPPCVQRPTSRSDQANISPERPQLSACPWAKHAMALQCWSPSTRPTENQCVRTQPWALRTARVRLAMG